MKVKEITAIIPAAGLATRMRPLSNHISKSMIPVNGKPIISWIFDSFDEINNNLKKLNYKIVKAVIVYKNEDIPTYIKNESRSFAIKCIKQSPILNGPGGAVLSARNEVVDFNHTLIWLGDTICLYPFGRNIFSEFNNSFVVTKKVDNPSRWCIVRNTDKGLEYYDKISYLNDSNTEHDALIGIYYMNDSSFWIPKVYLPEDKDIELSHILLNENVSIIDAKDTWYDCGELDTYYASCDALLSLKNRRQTVLKAENGAITKSVNLNNCSDINNVREKLRNERFWYENCSGFQKLYVPQIIKYDDYSYTMTKRSGTTLSDMLIYEDIPLVTWYKIIDKMIDIYHKHFVREIDENKNCDVKTITDKYWSKAALRITKDDIYKKFNINIEKTLDNVHKICDTVACQTRYISYLHSCDFCSRSVWHGDFHLGNILFDATTGQYTFLDPRGYDYALQFEHSVYDMAKLYHDLHLGYFLIVNNRYHFEDDAIGTLVLPERIWEKTKNIKKHLDNILKNEYKYDIKAIEALANLQMLTCLPFHKEDLNRCKAFLKMVSKEYELW